MGTITIKASEDNGTLPELIEDFNAKFELDEPLTVTRTANSYVIETDDPEGFLEDLTAEDIITENDDVTLTYDDEGEDEEDEDEDEDE